MRMRPRARDFPGWHKTIFRRKIRTVIPSEARNPSWIDEDRGIPHSADSFRNDVVYIVSIEPTSTALPLPPS